MLIFIVIILLLSWRWRISSKVKYIFIKQATNPWISQNVQDVIKLKSHYFKLDFVTGGKNNEFRNRFTSIIAKNKVATKSSYLNVINMLSDPHGI